MFKADDDARILHAMPLLSLKTKLDQDTDCSMDIAANAGRA
jgi:hypothetical protein